MLGRYTTGPAAKAEDSRGPRFRRADPRRDLYSPPMASSTCVRHRHQAHARDAPGDGRGRGRRRRLRRRPDGHRARGARRRAARQGGRPVRRHRARWATSSPRWPTSQRGAGGHRRRARPHRPARGRELRGRRRAEHPAARGAAGRDARPRRRSRDAFRDPTDVHDPITGLVVLENTHAHSINQPCRPAYVARPRRRRARGGVPLHIDGARFWNAVVALDDDAPRGARRPGRLRHVLPVEGPGLPGRQRPRRLDATSSGGPAGPGSCSAAGCARSGSSRRPGSSRSATARTGMIDRLADDHANARFLAEALAELPGIVSPGETAQPAPGPARSRARPDELRPLPGRARPRGVPRGARARGVLMLVISRTARSAP